ncbi:MAG: hypothetical protein MZV64_63005 [Ignavibacteriales bacterium]|nr:hypothetical protein [Ignavibacteriales bacterium]
MDLEEAGTFDFFDPETLEALLEETGWEILRIAPSYGDPPQGYVFVGQSERDQWQSMTRQFEDRLNQEYDLKGRTRMAMLSEPRPLRRRSSASTPSTPRSTS